MATKSGSEFVMLSLSHISNPGVRGKYTSDDSFPEALLLIYGA